MAKTTGYDKDRMMMRRNEVMVLAACAAMLLPFRNAFAQAGSPCVKYGFAFVSSNAILASIPEAQQADSLLQKDVAAYKLELTRLQGSFDSARQAFAQQSTLLGEAAKAAGIKKLEARQDSIQRRQDELSQKVQLRSQELMQPITLRVQQVLDGMRAELNCAVIFDVTATAGGLSIASADKTLDLTDRVIERLKGSPVKAPAKPPTGGIKPPSGGGGGGGDEPQPNSDLTPPALPAQP